MSSTSNTRRRCSRPYANPIEFGYYKIEGRDGLWRRDNLDGTIVAAIIHPDTGTEYFTRMKRHVHFEKLIAGLSGDDVVERLDRVICDLCGSPSGVVVDDGVNVFCVECKRKVATRLARKD